MMGFVSMYFEKIASYWYYLASVNKTYSKEILKLNNGLL